MSLLYALQFFFNFHVYRIGDGGHVRFYLLFVGAGVSKGVFLAHNTFHAVSAVC
jgi:hypothetical protein